MGDQISARTFIITIVATAAGTCLLSLLGCYLFIFRRRRVNQRSCEEGRDGKAALDRAVVRYIGKEQSNPPGPSAPERPPQLHPAMTTAINANAGAVEGDNLREPSPQSTYAPLAPVVGQGRARGGKTVTSDADTLMSRRRTASSHFLDSAERVYARILASPLERMRTWSPPTPPPRDDVGWPLPPEGWV
ncbi:hypothetical protein B0I37DRAFT_367088 [Chaetomium sp. MPI-CAGE-AT-0009]|nr:hypothetical protein B0I37DRAFT_367088 [Chaetomium sp. MPI-CAGE-AT-0009]